MRTIAIVFDNNDFGNTFVPLLESIHRAIDWNGGLSREVIEKAIRAGIKFHYIAFQHGNRYGQPGYPSVHSTVEYLSNIRILFDEEAEADICGVDHDSGAWYLEIPTGNVYFY